MAVAIGAVLLVTAADPLADIEPRNDDPTGLVDRWRMAAGWVPRTPPMLAPADAGTMVPAPGAPSELIHGRFGMRVECADPSQASPAPTGSRPFRFSQPPSSDVPALRDQVTLCTRIFRCALPAGHAAMAAAAVAVAASVTALSARTGGSRRWSRLPHEVVARIGLHTGASVFRTDGPEDRLIARALGTLRLTCRRWAAAVPDTIPYAASARRLASILITRQDNVGFLFSLNHSLGCRDYEAMARAAPWRWASAANALDRGEQYKTGLFVASCAAGMAAEAMEMLRVHGVNPSAMGSAALRLAARLGRGEVVAMLLAVEGERAVDPRADNNWAIRAAASYGHAEVVGLLLAVEGERAVDPRALHNISMREAIVNGHTEVVRLLLADDGPRGANPARTTSGGALVDPATCGNNRNGAAAPVDRVVNPGARGNLGLRVAAKRGHTDIVRLLLAVEGERAVDAEAASDVANRLFYVSMVGAELGHARAAALDRRWDRYSAASAADHRYHPCFLSKPGPDSCGIGLEIARLLAAAGAVPDGGCAIASAADVGDTEILRVLLDIRGEWEIYPGVRDNLAFREAARVGNAEAVALLLAVEEGRAVDPSARECEALIDAAEGGYEEIVAMLLAEAGPHRAVDPAVQGNAAIQRAALHGRTGVVDMLLSLGPEAGVNPSANGSYALRWACRYGHSEIVRRLLAVEGPGAVDPAVDENFPLRIAAEQGHTEVVAALLAAAPWRGVDPRTHDNLPIRSAAAYGHLLVATALVYAVDGESAVDPRARDGEALVAAARGGHGEIVQLLLAVRGERALGKDAVAAAFLAPFRSLQGWNRASVSSAYYAAEVLLQVEGARAIPRSVISRARDICMGSGSLRQSPLAEMLSFALETRINE